jgi:hypothetical protein
VERGARSQLGVEGDQATDGRGLFTLDATFDQLACWLSGAAPANPCIDEGESN